eukprot:TRINITY_DN2405_c0_g2_i1.p1 TRINITY_DN2405_c0_g2~~TRINITY_DN2405_c0_g2_i1.p1  ORF type:complete len:181 (+),score=49.06 TRINITY_DN2405_c0_g2_i1:70-612(+)
MNNIFRKLMEIYEYCIENEIIGPFFCESNADYSCKFAKDSPFFSSTIPSMGVLAYMHRIQNYANCSASALIAAGIYLDRVMIMNPEIMVNNFSFHRLFLTAVVLAAKYFDDKFFTNNYYSRVGGIKITELNKLEIELLFLLKFSLQISTEEFENFCNSIEESYFNIFLCDSDCCSTILKK